MDVARPAVPQLVAAVVLAQNGIGPVPQLGQLRGVRLAIQADPAGCGGAAGRGGVQGVGDCPGEFFEAGRQIQITAEPGSVEALADQRDLAAQGGYLGGQRGQAFPSACAPGSPGGLVITPPQSSAGGRPGW